MQRGKLGRTYKGREKVVLRLQKISTAVMAITAVVEAVEAGDHGRCGRQRPAVKTGRAGWLEVSHASRGGGDSDVLESVAALVGGGQCQVEAPLWGRSWQVRVASGACGASQGRAAAELAVLGRSVRARWVLPWACTSSAR